jgi:hypothetical protein
MTLMACYGPPPCKEKCKEERNRDLLLVLILDALYPSKSQTNSNTTSNNENSIDQKRTEIGNDVDDEIFPVNE